MPKITMEEIKAVYKAAKEIYLKKQKKNDALDTLKNVHKWKNENSASHYMTSFKAMMDGQSYHYTINSEATEYYFKSILSDFGTDKLKNALDATQAHVDYYANLENGGNQNKKRELIETYRAKLYTTEFQLPDEIPDESNYSEGTRKRITINAHERNAQARATCINRFGATCQVCDFDFAKVYGEIGKDYIHVHHLKPLSDIQENYQVDPITDLIPVCPNCHAMLHKETPPYTPEELQHMMKCCEETTI